MADFGPELLTSLHDTMPTPAPAPAPAPKTSYHHGNLRDELVREALAVIESQGLAALSLRQLARQLGVTQTAPLHHFEGKTGLLAAVAALGFRMLLDCRVQALQDLRDPAQRLMAVMLAYVAFAQAHPALYQLMHGPEIPDKSRFPELNEAAIRSYGILETCVGDYLRASEGSTERSREATLAAWAACQGLATIMTNPQNTPRSVLRKDPTGISRRILAMFIRGLSSPAG